MESRGNTKDSSHDEMVKSAISWYEGNGYQIEAADLKGYDQPEKISGKIPDIIAISKNEEVVVVEVETCGNLSHSRTKEQWEAFSAKPDSFFHVIVPGTCLKEAQNLATEWKIYVDKFLYDES